MPLQLLNDLRLVTCRQGRGREDGGQLGVLFEYLGQGGKGFGGVVQSRRLHGGSVLNETESRQFIKTRQS